MENSRVSGKLLKSFNGFLPYLNENLNGGWFLPLPTSLYHSGGMNLRVIRGLITVSRFNNYYFCSWWLSTLLRCLSKAVFFSSSVKHDQEWPHSRPHSPPFALDRRREQLWETLEPSSFVICCWLKQRKRFWLVNLWRGKIWTCLKKVVPASWEFYLYFFTQITDRARNR